MLAITLSVLCNLSHSTSLTPARITPQELKWIPLSGGVYFADLAGDEKKPGLYAYRVRFPKDHKNQPHFHPDDRTVTVISGTLYVGFGKEFNVQKMKALPAGSIWTEPENQPHYVWAKEGEVELQVTGVGPSGRTVIPQ